MSEHRILILCPTLRLDMAKEMMASFQELPHDRSIILLLGGSGPKPGAVWPLNNSRAWEGEYDTIGFINDDHRFVTPDWEAQIIEARQKYAVVYPNDCNNNESALTIPFFDARIPKALGFIAPPCLAHLYGDDFWFHLGHALHSIKYLPDCKIDHLHPFAGKREMDATTQAVNNDNVREHDRLAFYKYLGSEFPQDVEKARKAIQ